MDTLSDLMVPPSDKFGLRGGTLAFIAHLALVAMLFFGVQWTSRPPVAMQAELWSQLPPSQAPAQQAEAPPLELKEMPKVVKSPVIKKTEPIEQKKPDIALKDEKKKKPAEKEVTKKEPEKKQENKKVAEKKEASKKDTPKNEAAQPSDKPDPALAKLRNEEISRALAAAGGSAGNTSANANGTKGDPSYGDRIRSRILSNVVFNNAIDVNGNPEAVFMVEQLPTGEIISIKKVRSSGVAAWDDAVERAIRKSDPLPKSKTGSVERQLELTFRPKDAR